MAEDEVFGNIGEMAGEAAGASADALIIIFGILVLIGAVIGIVMVFKLFKSYKHIVKVRIITNDRKYIFEDKAREVLQDGVPFWKLKKRKDLLTVPPPEATEITQKGKFFAECYYTEEDGYKWIQDSGSVESNFKAFTTAQRSLYVQRLKNAMLRKKKGIWDLLQQYVTPVILLVLVVLILIFWQDLYKPVQESQQANARISQQQAEISQNLARITAVLVGDAEAGTLTFDQTVRANDEPTGVGP